MALPMVLRLLPLALVAMGSKLSSDLVTLDNDKEWKEKPIKRVVGLLQDMQAQLETEASGDQELYDKLVCWCETNDKEKTKAIADAKPVIKDAQAAIEENIAIANTREAEMEGLSKEQAEIEKALKSQDALRGKENQAFKVQQKDLVSSIMSLKGAVGSLGGVNSGPTVSEQRAENKEQEKAAQEAAEKEADNALLQVSQVLRRHVRMAEQAVAPHQRAQVRAMLTQPSNAISLLQQPVGGGQSYAPKSGVIFGILSQMKETFESNLETGKKNEAQAASDYQAIKTTKEGQLKAATDLLFTKSAEFNQAKENEATARETLEDTSATLAADEEFLAKLKKQCADINSQFEARSKVRGEEIAAIAETIGILTSDDARDKQAAAGQTFIQLHAESKQQKRQRDLTADFLDAEGRKLNSPRISYLALRVRNDVFASVKNSIDGMVGVLGDEQTAEIGKKDGCNEDFNLNDKQTYAQNDHKEDLETEINQLRADIDAKNQEEAMLREQVKDAQIELKRASEIREQENQDFQTVVKDQRATQEILVKAQERLKEFYQKATKQLGVLQKVVTQQQFLQRQVPPGSFDGAGGGDYSKNSGGGTAMVLLENIIEESKETEADAVQAENTAQKAYEEYVKATNDIIAAMLTKITNDEAEEAKEAEQEAQDESDKRSTIGDLIELGNVEETLHTSCDFTLNNFDERQGKRSQEMEALKHSKAIFSGANL